MQPDGEELTNSVGCRPLLLGTSITPAPHHRPRMPWLLRGLLQRGSRDPGRPLATGRRASLVKINWRGPIASDHPCCRTTIQVISRRRATVQHRFPRHPPVHAPAGCWLLLRAATRRTLSFSLSQSRARRGLSGPDPEHSDAGQGLGRSFQLRLMFPAISACVCGGTPPQAAPLLLNTPQSSPTASKASLAVQDGPTRGASPLSVSLSHDRRMAGPRPLHNCL